MVVRLDQSLNGVEGEDASDGKEEEVEKRYDYQLDLVFACSAIDEFNNWGALLVAGGLVAMGILVVIVVGCRGNITVA